MAAASWAFDGPYVLRVYGFQSCIKTDSAAAEEGHPASKVPNQSNYSNNHCSILLNTLYFTF